LKDQILGTAQGVGHLSECGEPPVDAGVGQLLVGFGIAHGIGAKQTPIGHCRVGKVGLAIMLEGGQGKTLMGKGEGRLLRERLSATTTLPTDDEAKDD